MELKDLISKYFEFINHKCLNGTGRNVPYYEVRDDKWIFEKHEVKYCPYCGWELSKGTEILEAYKMSLQEELKTIQKEIGVPNNTDGKVTLDMIELPEEDYDLVVSPLTIEDLSRKYRLYYNTVKTDFNKNSYTIYYETGGPIMSTIFEIKTVHEIYHIWKKTKRPLLVIGKEKVYVKSK